MRKKMWKKVNKAFLAFLLAAVMILEPAAGSMAAYAAEVSETAVDAGTEQEGGAETGNEEESGGGQETGGEETESPESSGENGEETDVEESAFESGEEDSSEDGEESSAEDGGENSEESSGESGSDEEEPGETDGTETADTEEETTEEESTGPDETALQETMEVFSEESLKAKQKELNDWAARTGRVPNGYIDVDFEVEELSDPVQDSDNSFPSAKASVSIPVRYDAREKNMVSSVKNQAGWGTCWAFSAVATAESAYKRMNGGRETDLSETHLVNFFYNGNAGIDLKGPDGGLSGDRTTAIGGVNPVQRGGNSVFTTFAMANWAGIADEGTGGGALKYPEPEDTWYTEWLNISSAYAYEDALHLENAYWISLSDRDSVKAAVMEYGTVGISFYYDWKYDSDSYKEDIDWEYDGSAVYYNPDAKSTNHAVSLVGWDDNFSRENFRYTWINGCAEEGWGGSVRLPKKDGAWLIKNSWGEGVSDGGYFWISYEDSSLAANVFAFDFGTGDNYDHNYQYDGSNGVHSYSGSQVTAAAVYTVNGEDESFQKVDAVGIGFASASTDYTVNIYTDLEDMENPESGILAATVSGKTSFAGFYTIEIDDAVIVEAGETFAVMVTAKKSGKASLFVDETYQNGSWVKFDAATEHDRTYYKSGKTWYDAGKKKKCTFRIKAYTNDTAAPEINLSNRVLSMDMLEEILPQEYTGERVEPKPVLYFYSREPLKEGTDYTIAYSDNIAVSDGSQRAKMTITGIGEYSGSELEVEFDIVPKTIDADMVSLDRCVYDGDVHGDIAAVLHNGNALKKGEDYTVQYSKTLQDAGNYSVTVTGINNYAGSVKQNFTVEKLSLDDPDIEVTGLEDAREYTGKGWTPQIQILYLGKIIPAANYTVKYQDNKNAGTAGMTITGKKNCIGSAVKEFRIDPKPVMGETVTVSVKEGTYSGKEVTPAVTVKDGKTTLKKDRDYTLAYENNVNASEAAKVIVTGMGNYAGTRPQAFTIKQLRIASSKIAVSLSGAYGKESSACLVYVNGNKLSGEDYDLAIINADQEKIDEKALMLGEKYDITVTLKNNYSGSTTVKNVACVRDVNSLPVSLAQGNSYTYTGSAQKPAVIVNDETGKALKQGTDYTIAYANNTNAGEASVTVTGKGNYGGTLVLPFTISPKEAARAELSVSIPAQNYTGAELKPSVTVKYGKKKLKAGTDYWLGNYTDNKNVSYDEQQNVTAGAGVEIILCNYTVKQEEGAAGSADTLKGTFLIKPVKITSVKLGTCYYAGGNAVEPPVTVMAGKLALAPEDYEVAYSDNMQVGGKAKASVTAKQGGNYTGNKTVTFKIAKESLSKATVEGISDQSFTGNAITFWYSQIQVKNSSGSYVPSSVYTITYKNNQKVGTASVTIKANTGSIYSGSKTVKFKINKADIGSVLGDVTLQQKVYTGKKLTCTNEELRNALASASLTGNVPSYKVSYVNNVDAGTAKIILTGTGSYTGTKEIAFTISPGNIKDAAVRLKSNKLNYNGGNPVYAQIAKIVCGKTALKQGRDYTVSYVNSKGTGTAVVRITGRGNYSGMKSVYYSISENESN